MSPDAVVGIATLAALFALEGLLPYYQGRDHRYAHGLTNLTLALLSGAIGAALAPVLLLTTELAAAQGLGIRHLLGLDGLAAAVITFLLFDLWMYAWHRANHEVAFLWRFHRVHHTDPAMDCTTALRFHPGEILLSNLANLPVLVALGMTFETFVVYKSAMVAVILFHHSNVDVPHGLDRALRRLVVPPSMHRVHHSEIAFETNSNYGTVFSFWDRLFGSFRRRDDLQALRFGIGRFDERRWQRPLGLILLPFRQQSKPPVSHSP